jgi:predicted GIY-YIG superfamily endonuclease
MPSERTAVYRLYDKDDVLLYVGITSNLDQRFSAHAAGKAWWPDVTRREIAWCSSRIEAEATEVLAIGSEKPRHNVSPGNTGNVRLAAGFAEGEAAAKAHPEPGVRPRRPPGEVIRDVIQEMRYLQNRIRDLERALANTVLQEQAAHCHRCGTHLVCMNGDGHKAEGDHAAAPAPQAARTARSG